MTFSETTLLSPTFISPKVQGALPEGPPLPTTTTLRFQAWPYWRSPSSHLYWRYHRKTVDRAIWWNGQVQRNLLHSCYCGSKERAREDSEEDHRRRNTNCKEVLDVITPTEWRSMSLSNIICLCNLGLQGYIDGNYCGWILGYWRYHTYHPSSTSEPKPYRNQQSLFTVLSLSRWSSQGDRIRRCQCFRSLPADISQHHALCDTYSFLCIDILGGKSISEIFNDLKSRQEPQLQRSLRTNPIRLFCQTNLLQLRSYQSTRV